MTIKKTLFLLIFTIGVFFTSISQNYPILFNEKSGLPSNRVYDCLQDNLGKMWFSTDNGVSSYDGYNFTNYNLTDGLSTLFSWELHKDSRGRIWLANRQTPFTYIYKDSVYRVGNKLTDIYFSGLYEDKNGNIYITSLPSKKTHKIDVNNNVSQIDSTLLGINTLGDKIWLNHKIRFKHSHILGHLLVGDFVITYNKKYKIGIRFLGVYNTVTKKKYEVSLSDLEGSYRDINFYKEDKITITTSHKIYVLNLKTKAINSFFEEYYNYNNNPSKVYIDNNKNLWIPDLKDGIVFMQNIPKNITYTSCHSDISYISQTNDISLTTKNKIIKISEDTIKEIAQFDRKAQPFFLGNYNHKNIFYSKKNHLLYIINENKILDKNTFTNLVLKRLPVDDSVLNSSLEYKIPIGVLKHSHWKNGTLNIGANKSAFSLKINKDSIKIRVWANNNYAFGVCNSKKWVYLGTNNGLFKINKLTAKKDTICLGNSITDVVSVNNYVFARDITGNIIQYDTNNTNSTKLFKHLNFLHKIEEIDGELWGLSNNKIVLLSQKNLTVKFELNNQQGIINPHKIALKKLADKYYLFCSEGYYVFSKTDSLNLTPIKNEYFKIKSIHINNNLSKSISKINLQNNNNFIQIKLNAFKYPSSSKLKYSYKYGKGNWHKTSNPEISILNAPFGNYQIYIKSELENGKNFGSIIEIKISNPFPFYYKTWFFLLIFCLILMSILFLFNIRNQRKINSSNVKFKLTQNKHKMLTMQMKPHFLSNVFNNLQGAMLSDNLQKSSELIKNVDQYLRQTLKSSTQDFVTLKQEVDNVNQYIKIEQERVHKKIKLILPEKWETEINKIIVPVFILQPIIENAIWHGIQKSNNKIGKININIDENKFYNIIIIKNNGARITINERNGNSIALKNIEERLELIDLQKRKKYIELYEIENTVIVKLYVTKKIKNNTH